MRAILLASLLLASITLAAACGGGDDAGRSEGGALISEGSVAPDFRLPAAGGETVSLSDYGAEDNVLLYFSMGSG